LLSPAINSTWVNENWNETHLRVQLERKWVQLGLEKKLSHMAGRKNFFEELKNLFWGNGSSSQVPMTLHNNIVFNRDMKNYYYATHKCINIALCFRVLLMLNTFSQGEKNAIVIHASIAGNKNPSYLILISLHRTSTLWNPEDHKTAKEVTWMLSHTYVIKCTHNHTLINMTYVGGGFFI
jgi:hypothetical protein